MGAYRERELGIDLAELDECLVEVLDRLRGVFMCLVADIADAATGEELDVGDRELGKMLAHGVVGESRRQPAHKNARRSLHGGAVRHARPSGVVCCASVGS
jgi:hypothetical protein